MGYLSLLDDARARLNEGGYLEAERLYFEACRQWEGSRFTAPVLERGVDPVLRGLGRLFGRDAGEPVLPRFSDRAAAIRADLEEVARLLAREAREAVSRPPRGRTPEHARRLGHALELLRESRIFQLEPGEHWPVLRAYLECCHELGTPVDASLLPPSPGVPDGDAPWLCGFAEEALRRGGPELGALARWLEPVLAAVGGAPLGHGLTLACRLALVDPGGAPRALALGRRALDASPPEHEAAGLLRAVAGLATNELRLAGPGGGSEALRELEPRARELGLAWPPAELAARLARREGIEAEQLLALAWEEDGAGAPRVLLLRLRAGQAADALCLRPHEDPRDPFALAPTRARERLAAWAGEQLPVLVARRPPEAIASLLAPRRIVDLERIEAQLPALAPRRPTPMAVAPHPVLDGGEDPVAAPWAPLRQEALALWPRLLCRLDDPAFASGRGRANLDRLGQAGLALAGDLARCLRRAGLVREDGAGKGMGLGTAVELQCAPLDRRPWPAGAEAPDRPAWSGEGDHLLPRAPSAAELAGWALACQPCELLATDEARALELGRRAAAADPLGVTVAPRRPRCPEALLGLLDGWLQEAATGSPGRDLDVLWLYGALARCPEGDPGRWLGGGGSPEGQTAVREALEGVPEDGCAPGCRLHASGCMGAGREARRARGGIWIEWVGGSAAPATEPAPTLLVDDLVPALAPHPDAEALARLQRLGSRMAAAPRVVAWASAGPFARGLRDRLGELLPPGRSFHLPTATTGEATPSVALAPAGYAPGASLLGEEALALVVERTRRARTRGARTWWPAGLELPGLEATADDGSRADVVALPLLAAPGPVDPALGLLRLAHAASRARHRLLCLDPRAAGELLASIEDAAHVGSAEDGLAEGAAILRELPARQLAGWQRPFLPSRLARAAGQPLAEGRLSALSEALVRLEHGQAVGLGGATEDERQLVAATAARLALESGDGGPLGVRTVAWVDERRPRPSPGLPPAASAADGGLEELLLAADRGSLPLLHLHPGELGDEALRRWARRSEGLLWIVARAEPWLEGGEEGALATLARLRAEAGSTLLACVDDPARGAGAVLPRLAAQLDARVSRLPLSTGVDERWTFTRVRPEDPTVACPGCGEARAVAHPWAACPACGHGLLHATGQLELAREQLLAGLARWLSGQGPHARWLVLASSVAERDRLRSALGLEEDGSAGAGLPLAGEESWTLDVRVLEELWSRELAPSRLLLSRLPANGPWLRQLLLRLAACGWEPGEVHAIDHPLHAEGPGRARPRLAWACGRAELEARLGAVLDELSRALLSSGDPGAGEAGLGPAGDPLRPGELAPWLGALLALGEPHEVAPLEATAREAIAGASGGAVVGPPVEPVGQALQEWAQAAGLLRAAAPAGPEVALPPDDNRWREQLRKAPPGQAQPLPLPEPAAPAPGAASPARPASEWGAGPWLLGIAGTGKTQELAAVAGRERAAGRRVLALTPGRSALVPLHQALQDVGATGGERPPVELATTAELCLSFLRRHREGAGFSRRPRLLPPAATPAGEARREELMREASRRYALVAGRVPAIESGRLRRLLEGDAAAASLVAAGEEEAVDLELLRRCAHEAAREGGWVHAGELGGMARRLLESDPGLASGWRQRYPAVLLDGAHALDADTLAFVEALFPAEERWTAADPLLLEQARQVERGELRLRSSRLPRGLARATEQLYRQRPELRSRLHGQVRGGKVRTEHVMSLEACAQRCLELLEPGRGKSRQAVVLAHEADRLRLAARLREEGWEAWDAAVLERYCAPGLDAFLAALWIAAPAADTPTGTLGDLAALLLGRVGLPCPDGAGDALRRWHERGAGPPREPGAAWLQALLEAGHRVGEAAPPRDWARALEASGLLAPLLASDAVAGRIDEFVAEAGERPWAELRGRVHPALLLHPGGPPDGVLLCGPRQLEGREFDLVLQPCTGHEPAELLYRGLSRSTQGMVFLYSERDPLAHAG